jgi:hypothetical protein
MNGQARPRNQRLVLILNARAHTGTRNAFFPKELENKPKKTAQDLYLFCFVQIRRRSEII